MRYNVAQLLIEPIGSTRSYQLEEAFSGPGRIADSARGSVCLLRTHQGVLVDADLEVQATLTCSRCLSEFTRDSVVAMEVEFFPTVDVHTGGRLLPSEDLEDGHIDDSHNLDLTDMLRQYVIADLPMKPLCKPRCLGLCQVCGTNLNDKECDCKDEAGYSADGAWSQLVLPRNV
jgi:uncharacterized protein